jgi:hypothetical protein
VVGAAVGATVGATTGCAVGATVGAGVGLTVMLPVVQPETAVMASTTKSIVNIAVIFDLSIYDSPAIVCEFLTNVRKLYSLLFKINDIDLSYIEKSSRWLDNH